MIRFASAVLISLIAATGAAASASCQLATPPLKTLDAEVGSTTDTLTKNRGTWDEQYLTVSTRNGHTNSEYGSLTTDRRFGQTDTTYEGGSYFLLAPKLTFDAIASFSPTHQVLPNTSLQGGLDLRTGRGYGLQADFTQRNYPTAVADITSVGTDRYAGDAHFGVAVTAVHLSNVPGTAMSAGLTYARNLRCDNLAFALSGGRDVENTGVGADVAIYQVISYTADDLHWFTPHTALSVGAGWYLLTGAYDRFEVHVALHERI